MMSRSPAPVLAFGAFRIDVANALLLRDGAAVALPPKAIQVLRVLVERAGHVVDKEELLSRVWSEDEVEENNIAQAICAIRAALKDRQRPYRFVETIPRRGYRLVAPEVAAPCPADPEALDQSRATNESIVVAVSPFRWLNPHPAGEALTLAAGLTEALFTRFANQPGLRATRLATTTAGATSAASPTSETTLDGAVQWVGDQVRVSVQLLDSAAGIAKWGETFDEQVTSVLETQDVLSERIGRAVGARLVPTIHQPPRLRVGDRAYLAYLKGRHLLGRRTRAALLGAVHEFKTAMASESLAALAHVGVAEAHTLLGEYDYVPAPTALATARLAAEQALAKGARGQAHTSLAEARLYCDWDCSGAEHEYRRAIALEPRYATAHHWYGWYLVTQGRFTEGLAELQSAHDLDPLSLIITTDLGWALMSAEEYDRAVPQLQHAASMDSGFFFAPYYLGLAYSLQGRYEAAIREFQTAEQIEPNAQVEGQLGFLYGVTDQRDHALARLRRLEARSQTEYVSPYLLALVHAGLDEQDLALGWFARAIRERSASLVWPGAKLISSHLGGGSRLVRLLDASGVPR